VHIQVGFLAWHQARRLDLFVRTDPRTEARIMRKSIIGRVRKRRERRDYYRALDNASPSMLHELQSMALRQNS
jgi:hypothetical protein